MEQQNLIQSFNCAIEGFIYVLKTQRNMRIHFLFAVFILLLGIYLDFSGWEILILCAAITFVLLSEMINTAIELAIDLISNKFHPLARMAKDVSAGAVFIASLNALIAGYLLFSKRLKFSLESGVLRVKQSPWHLTFISIIVVLALVVIIKVLTHKGTPMRGGMPSGHSAAAFSMWTVVALSTTNELIIILTFLMALLIARSRLTGSIHTIWEVIAGGALGTLITVLVFQLLT